MRPRRDPLWVVVLLVAAACVVTVPALMGGARSWWLWASLAINGVVIAIVSVARGVPPGATRDFLTWLAFATWLLWAVGWMVIGRSA